MQVGLIMSVIFHVSLLAWALWAVHMTDKHDLPDTPPIDVAIITPSELTRLRQGDPDSQKMTAKADEKPSEEISKKEAPKPKPITAPEPPAAAPPPPSEPEEAKAEPPKPEPEKKPEPAKPDPIADKIAALPPEPEPKPGPTPDELKKLEEQKQAEEAAKKAEEEK